MTSGKKIYFASDAHLGFPDHARSLEREKKLNSWLDSIRDDVEELYLVGDIFDFWFEYSRVIPKGYSRFFGRIASLTDSGIPVHFFTGNHDLWIRKYFTEELGLIIHRDKIIREINGKKFFIAHGDGLGPSDIGFKYMKKLFTSPVSKWLYSRIHPNLGMALGSRLSRNSRYNDKPEDFVFQGEEKERLILYAKRKLEQEHFDFFIFGHRHIPLDIPIGTNTRFVNLGDWIRHFTYAEFDGENISLKTFEAK